jgi:hypothetical protein
MWTGADLDRKAARWKSARRAFLSAQGAGRPGGQQRATQHQPADLEGHAPAPPCEQAALIADVTKTSSGELHDVTRAPCVAVRTARMIKKMAKTSLFCWCALAIGCAGADDEYGQLQDPLASVSCGAQGEDAGTPVEHEPDGSVPDAGAPERDAGKPEVDAGPLTPSHPYGLAHDAPGCAACRNEACTAYQGVFDLVAACLTHPDPAFAQACIDVMDCAYAHRCGYGATGAPECFCGTADLNACQTAGNANGPCQAEFYAAAHTTQLGELIGRFGDVSLPVGVAYYFLECDRDSCAACAPTAAP